MTVKPFRAVRPDKKFAGILNVPPYDVIDTNDVRKAVEGNPFSFFHITRAEVDIPGIKDEHAEEVYLKARENFERFIKDGILFREDKPCFYLFSQTWHGRTQTGIYSAVSCEEYEKNQIRKHELTRRDKEEDRTNHIKTVRADTGPVFLAFENSEEYFELIEQIMNEEPEYFVNDENEVENKLWVIGETQIIQKIIRYFSSIPAFYIADGHHRAASACNVYQSLKDDPEWKDRDGYRYFMAVIFPSSQLEIMPYNRIVMDLNGLSKNSFIEKIKDKFILSETEALSPQKKGEIVMYLDKNLYLLQPKAGTFDSTNPQDSLDVSILQKNLLMPVLGIGDPRTSSGIKFVGGIKGPQELIRLVDNGNAAVSFCMYPVSMKELMDVTNRNLIMPPKSTWFEPKLRDGLITYCIE